MTEKVLTIEEMEKIMTELEEGGDSGRPVAAPVAEATPKPTTASPLKLNEFVDADQLKKDVEFDPRDLDNAVRSHAGLFVHYANLSRLARRQFERMKAACEILESRLDAHYRTTLKADGSKVTDKAIDAAVKGDPRWWAAQNRMIDAKAIYDLASDAREAFTQRKDMIVQVSVDRRREREGEFRVKEDPSVSTRQGILDAIRGTAS
jgi:hypothetical protein